MARLKQSAAPAQEDDVCWVCKWPAATPPGACAKENCGLRDQIHAARNATRARLGLPALTAQAEWRRGGRHG
ncbi:hypothetical protein [Camelimonas lactis]|uniref:Uncharacterized protein n=1 Tax=Camelimonas lactis TaxID=659006 RepID=A0A4V2RXV1_9HYPH|nr:hypothetical protein [Camelimonas lactis]TCO15858.1 hypothetical protein EV666_101107 [Camelimonas lactis]